MHDRTGDVVEEVDTDGDTDHDDRQVDGERVYNFVDSMSDSEE